MYAAQSNIKRKNKLRALYLTLNRLGPEAMNAQFNQDDPSY